MAGNDDIGEETFTGKALAVMRGERLLFKGLSFAVGPGQALVLRGANGSGKTTLLRIMAGLTRPLAGRTFWGERPCDLDPGEHRRRVGLIGHRLGLKEDLSVLENLRFEAGLRGRPEGALVAAMERLALTGLADLPLRLLSAGQRRRVALSRLALGGGPLWLLDEPATALDSASEETLWQLCRERLAGGERLVIASHSTVPLDGLLTLAVDRPAA